MIPQAQVPEGYGLRDIQLELSLKPFFDSTAATREAVCCELFEQWRPLARYAESVSVLLWIGDGSEILEYAGKMDAPFEWARYNGTANHHEWPSDTTSDNPDHNGIGIAVGSRDPEQKGIHCRSYLYRPDPAVFTYSWLQGLVDDLKRIGGELLGKPIWVGNTFDIGPEFARSKFKYEWHREILSDGPVFKEQFISCEGVLHGDDRVYAAYPKGIPEGTTIGSFLGRQTRRLFDDCGFDFLWLSNGFGYALEPWAMVGQVFDGAEYHPERAGPTAERIMGFWRDLRSGLGNETPLRCRGTNLATGIDMGSDASPVKRIFEEVPNVEAPVNSPWAALDGDFGLELAGWMSHIAIHPGESFRFRFYIHDPWWLNSPWFDRYGRRAHDLSLPLSVSRLQPDGSVEIPRDLAFLTVNDSHGQMPPAGTNEVTAFFLRAREKAPDAMGPLVWVYPMTEFEHLAMAAGKPERPFHADAWMGTVINAGVPMNTVAEAEVLATALRKDPTLAQGRVFFAPVPMPGSAYETVIKELIALGADLLLVGPIFEKSFLWEAFGLKSAGSLQGDFEWSGSEETRSRSKLRHLDFLSAGGWSEAVGEAEAAERLALVEFEQDGAKRVAVSVHRTEAGGRLGWIRGSLTTGEFDPEAPKPIRGPILQSMKDEAFLANGALTRVALEAYGWKLNPEGTRDMSTGPYLTAHRHRNGFVLSGYHRNEHSVQRLKLPLGAPLLMGCNNRLENGETVMTGEVAWQYEVRVFVQGMAEGQVMCREVPQLMHGVHRRIVVSGLKDATVQVLPDPEHLDTIRLLRDPMFPYFMGAFIEPEIKVLGGHSVITIEGLSGELLIEW